MDKEEKNRKIKKHLIVWGHRVNLVWDEKVQSELVV